MTIKDRYMAMEQSSDNVMSPDAEKEVILSARRKVEGLALQIRNEIDRLADLSDQISEAYSTYASSDNRYDTELSIHNGLGNMLKLIEVQNVVKLRIKRMQVMMLKVIADSSTNDDLPYAVADLVKDVNVGFLDSKLVRAYGEISKFMREDIEVSRDMSNRVEFTVSKALDIEDIEDIDELDELDELDEVGDGEVNDEANDE